jgi:hypothetical protein
VDVGPGEVVLGTWTSEETEECRKKRLRALTQVDIAAGL